MKSNPSIAVRFQINPCVSISCALSYRFLVVVREVILNVSFASSPSNLVCTCPSGGGDLLQQVFGGSEGAAGGNLVAGQGAVGTT